jgi:hypothetical protein
MAKINEYPVYVEELFLLCIHQHPNDNRRKNDSETGKINVLNVNMAGQDGNILADRMGRYDFT